MAEEEEETEARADRMQAELDELDEHIDDAKKKADGGQPQASPDDDVIDDVAGGGTDNTDEVDDPAGPIIGPE
jgi:hypothetical protein